MATDDPLLNDSTVCTRGFFAQVLAPVVKAIGRPMKDERDKLEARIAALEARPQALAHGGTWASGQRSEKNYFYTDRGSVWFCRESTHDRPGETDAFVLAVKAGRDAR